MNAQASLSAPQSNPQANVRPGQNGQQRNRRGNAPPRPRQVRASKPVAQNDASQDVPTPAQSNVSTTPQRPGPPRNRGLAASLGSRINPDFSPKALSTSASTERRDVLQTDAILVEGISGGVAVERDRRHLLDYSQFVQIVESSYRVMTRQDRGMQKHISLAMYQYYCVTLLWKRLTFIQTARGDKVNEFETLKRKLPPMSIPDEIGYYLDGIGNVADYNDRKFYLSIQAHLRPDAILGIPGHYGRVDAVSHIQYETLPSPYVAVYRILQDLLTTDAVHHHPSVDHSIEWDLPVELRPEGGFIPNRNLLGWNVAEPLTDEQVRTLRGAGLNAVYERDGEDWVPELDTSGVQSFMGYPIVYPLLLSISEILSSAKSNQSAFNAHAESVSTMGSVAQVGFNARMQDASRQSGRALKPIFEREATGLVYSQASTHIFSAISLFRYRVRRVVRGYNDSLCYTGAQGGAPHLWANNADEIYESAPPWNHEEFRTTLVSGRSTSDAYSHNVRKVPQSDRL